MIRKIYFDFFREKLGRRDYRWLLRQGGRYVLTQASYLGRRAMCGPVLGTLVTNYRCNYRCKMCGLPGRDEDLRRKGLLEFETGRMRQLLRDFADLGTTGIGFTGGEPLLREDIFELLAFTKELGMFAHLNTNGFLLDEGRVRRLLDSGVDSVNVSLDGATAATHDRIRGQEGAFERAVQGIKRIVSMRKGSSRPPRLKAVTVVGEENVGEVPRLVEFLFGLGVDCAEFIPEQDFLREGETASRSEGFLRRVEEVSSYLLSLKKQGAAIENSCVHLGLFGRSFRRQRSPLRCFSGYSSCAVDCYGEVYPCVPWVNWGRSVGNVGSGSLKEFWYSARYARARRGIGKCRGCYLNCQAELNLLFNVGALRWS